MAARSRAAALLGVLVSVLAWVPARAAEPEVAMTRLSDQGSLQVSIVKATRGSGPDATVVAVLQGGRGEKLFLRRAPGARGAVVHDAWIGSPPAVTITRRPGEPALLQASGRSFQLLDADLARPTVRCWIGAAVSRVDPKLLDVSFALKQLRGLTNEPGLGDVAYPVVVLSHVGEASGAEPRGALKAERGPFAGEPWEQLVSEALKELGRP